jgi:hypothetical protein
MRAMMSLANPEALFASAAAAVGEEVNTPGASLAAAARAAGSGSGARRGAGAGPSPPPPPPPPSVELVPTPGFVVKTRDEHGRKVFVNVCGSPLVAAPGDWANGQVRSPSAHRHTRNAT